jgi:hypothetical protein
MLALRFMYVLALPGRRGGQPIPDANVPAGILLDRNMREHEE